MYAGLVSTILTPCRMLALFFYSAGYGLRARPIYGSRGLWSPVFRRAPIYDFSVWNPEHVWDWCMVSHVPQTDRKENRSAVDCCSNLWLEE